MLSFPITLKYLINEHVRLLSLDFDSSMRLFSSMFVYFADFLPILFVYYIMFVYHHGQNLGLFLLSIFYFLCTTSIWFFWIEKITCNFEIRLLAGALLAGALLAAHFKLNMEFSNMFVYYIR